MTNEPVPKGNNSSPDTFRSLSVILKELGLPSFILVIIVGIFIVFGSPAQKAEFIDRFILLKTVATDPFPFILVVIFLVLVIIIGGYYQQKQIKSLKSENKRIGAEKSKLQEQLINSKLSSSKD